MKCVHGNRCRPLCRPIVPCFLLPGQLQRVVLSMILRTQSILKSLPTCIALPWHIRCHRFGKDFRYSASHAANEIAPPQASLPLPGSTISIVQVIEGYACRFLCTVVSIAATSSLYTARFNSFWSRY